VDKIARMRRTEHAMTGELGRDPTREELAAKLDVDPKVIDTWKVVALRPTSLDAPMGEDDTEVGEIIPDKSVQTPYEELNDVQLREEVEHLMHRLDEREREILKYRFGLENVEPETLEVVGKRFDITRERVRQIQNAAVVKLREMMEEQDRPQTDDEEAPN
jgi:RNA polymerase primary sigma factor